MLKKKRDLAQADFDALKQFIYKISSIDIKDKRYLLEQRIEPILDKYSLENYSDLINKLLMSDTAMVEEVLTAITTNETFFFRDKRNFDEIESIIIPILYSHASHREVRIWCAACSTGQEPFSLAMIIASYAETHPNEKLFLNRFKIIASDIDQNVLNKARRGEYTDYEMARGLPDNMKRKFFTEKNGKWAIDNKIIKMVNFTRMNLTEPVFYPSGLDLILCRNVLIYFDEKTKKKIVNNMYKSLNLEGYFILGASESLFGIDNESFDRVILDNFIMYTKK